MNSYDLVSFSLICFRANDVQVQVRGRVRAGAAVSFFFLIIVHF